MADTTSQAMDVEYVKSRCIIMQRDKASGNVTVRFQDGVVQIVEMNKQYWPPGRKKNQNSS